MNYYCVKCKKIRQPKDERDVEFNNGDSKKCANCIICGTFMIGKTEED